MTDKNKKKEVLKDKRKKGFSDKKAMFAQIEKQSQATNDLKISEDRARAAQEKVKKMMTNAEKRHEKKLQEIKDEDSKRKQELKGRQIERGNRIDKLKLEALSIEEQQKKATDAQVEAEKADRLARIAARQKREQAIKRLEEEEQKAAADAEQIKDATEKKKFIEANKSKFALRQKQLKEEHERIDKTLKEDEEERQRRVKEKAGQSAEQFRLFQIHQQLALEEERIKEEAKEEADREQKIRKVQSKFLRKQKKKKISIRIRIRKRSIRKY